MSLIALRESPDETRDEAISILSSTRSSEVSERRFRWLYQDNPDGPAAFWSVRDGAAKAMAGFTVCLPRRMLVSGGEVLAWNGADFSILPKYRTLGIALKLRRAAKTEVDAGTVGFLYSHPNQRMQVIHEQVGHSLVGRMVRYAKILDVGSKTPRFLSNFARIISNPSNGSVLRLLAREYRYKYQNAICLEDDLRFDTGFDHLFADVADRSCVIGIRDAAYLDWRYKQCPMQQFQLFTARQSNQLQGYLIFGEWDGMVFIQDVFAKTPHALADLLVAATRLARKRKAKSISMQLLEDSAVTPCLTKLGFRERSDFSNMFAYASSPKLKNLITDSSNWLIHAGDRDV